jgi:L-2-hydroxycarboxylate dehydrogenase (NAD+)
MKKNKLKKLITEIFVRHKLSKNHAKICSEAIINAELVGAPSHGLSRLKMYCDRIKKRVINPKPKIKIKKISQSITHIDASNSIGFVAADIGIKKAISNAKKTGFGLVGIKNSGHYGLSGYYAEQAVKKNLIAFIFTNAPPAIAPHGALKSLFGTNPICFGTPTNSKIPFILDTSVSMINRGKIRVASRTGEKIPEGVALDKFGNLTTDAKKALEGVQLPIAGFRGSGLAWMVDILSGVFTGGNHGGKVKDPFDDFTGPQNIGHLFIVIKSNIFVKNFNRRIKENIKRIKKLPKLKGVKEILYPGQNKYKRFKDNLKKEIEINKNIEKDLKELKNQQINNDTLGNKVS